MIEVRFKVDGKETFGYNVTDPVIEMQTKRMMKLESENEIYKMEIMELHREIDQYKDTVERLHEELGMKKEEGRS